MKNKTLLSAKKTKNDEFYTREEDIANELKYYWQYFENKSILLNCDDPEESNFWRYFKNNFSQMGLKRLVSTHYHPEKSTYWQELVDSNEDGIVDFEDVPEKHDLKGCGDFRDAECVEILKEADIVCTNPPFSLSGSTYHNWLNTTKSS